MIITITGKPCSGKGTVSKIFCDKYKFEYISAGQLMRDIAVEKNFEDILSFTQSDNIKDTDIAVEKWTAKIGETRLDEDIIIDARLAWFTIPKSFKVSASFGDRLPIYWSIHAPNASKSCFTASHIVGISCIKPEICLQRIMPSP